MKVFLSQLLTLEGKPLQIKEELADQLTGFEHSLIRKIESCQVSGEIIFDAGKQRASVALGLVGSMILPHSVTNQAVSIPFDTELLDVFSFVDGDTDEDVVEVKENFIDFDPWIFEAIVAAIPLRIVDDRPYQYPSGKGWKVMSEKDYEAQEKPLDPRLAKLKEYKFD